ATVRTLDGRKLGSSFGVEPVTRAAFSPDGRMIATALRYGTVQLWDARTHQKLRLVGVPLAVSRNNELHDIAFSADSRLLAMGGGDRVVRIFDTRSGKLANEFKLSKSVDNPYAMTDADHSVRAVALQPNGTRVAAGDADGVVNLWDRKDRAVHR